MQDKIKECWDGNPSCKCNQQDKVTKLEEHMIAEYEKNTPPQQDNGIVVTKEILHQAAVLSNADQREMMERAEKQDNGLEEWNLIKEAIRKFQYEDSYTLDQMKGVIISALAKERKLGQQDYARNLGAACTKAGITITDLADYEGVVKAIQNSEEVKFEESLNVLYQKHQRELQEATAAERAKWVEAIKSKMVDEGIYKEYALESLTDFAYDDRMHNLALTDLLNSRKGDL